MVKQTQGRKQVFLEAEKFASDLALLSGKRPDFLKEDLEGVLSPERVDQEISRLRSLSVDEYIRATVNPSENPKRKTAPEVIRQLGGRVIKEISDGPLFLAEVEFQQPENRRRLLFLAQNRKNKNGVWMPHHHNRAADLIRYYSSYGMPVVTFIDTPGADAGEEANRQNQAHSISWLIMEMANLQLPTVGIILGNGYSGGAIPLATTNVLLSVRDGVFNTIHPMGLAEIAYNYNLSWQECAKYMGVSPFELYRQGYLDGVVDYSPLDDRPPTALAQAIFSALNSIEQRSAQILRDPTYEFFFQHYQESIGRYLNPSRLLIEENRISEKTPTGMLNVFGSVYRFHRYLKSRLRLSSQNTLRYSRAGHVDSPKGQLLGRLEADRLDRFNKWLAAPLEVRYDDDLAARYKKFLDTLREQGTERTRLASLFKGNPETNYRRAVTRLTQGVALYLYNYWKDQARDNLGALLEHVGEGTDAAPPAPHEANLLSILKLKPVAELFPWEVQNLILFDLAFDKMLDNITLTARELKETNQITQESLEGLLDKVVHEATEAFQSVYAGETEKETRGNFLRWLEGFTSQKTTEKTMRQISEWKRLASPRISEPLFGLMAYLFTHLLPSLYQAQRGEKRFDGRINPRNIGIKDFWNRLSQAYDDLQIQTMLAEYKRTVRIQPQQLIETFFQGYEELNGHLMTSDPVRFPGFRQSINRALETGIPPVGVLTGIASFKHEDISTQVGVVVSNTNFQAGAFDMASGEKVCKLLVECASRRLPVVMFISSGGMQTKEGAGALFSMSVLNDRITRFVKDIDLPVICFGFRDCTGGAQASFVTHHLAKVFYLSGAVIPFAGQRVVPKHLPVQAILANYLSQNEGTMHGLVHNPFDPGLDDKLREIDPSIPLPSETIPQAIARILRGEYQVHEGLGGPAVGPVISFEPLQRVLIHARGCTAARLVKGAQDAGLEVVLVQSDADMESHPAEMLRPNDRLVCLGGNTPQESYLNGLSVIRIAEQEDCDAIHPGIGFLSENPDFAKRCRRHGLNFVGPSHISMEMMGNKSNAIATSRQSGVPVVPGSHGVITEPLEAKAMADEIGYPVLIKAAFGGGGKGIRVVYEPDQFVEAFNRTTTEALGAFGNGDVYLEKFVESMRHVEAQVLRDSHGNTRIMGYRDCSVQRDNQKLVEESGSYKFTQRHIDDVTKAAEKLAKAVDYVGAGTVEYIYDRVNDSFYFMEMNTRLQVEHPVTEEITGVDLVEWQLRVASGEPVPLKQEELSINGWAMEARLYAEDPITFLPSIGPLEVLRLPEDEDLFAELRVETGVEEGDSVSPFYDPMIAKIVVSGGD